MATAIRSLSKQNRYHQILKSVSQMLQKTDDDQTMINQQMINQLAKEAQTSRGLKLQIEHLSQYAQCKMALSEKNMLGKIDVDALSHLPEHTLGYHYGQFMQSHQLKPLETLPVTHTYSFMATHLLETHDIWHVIIDANVDTCGEMKLAAFYAAQLKTSAIWYALMAKNLLKAVIYNIEDAHRYMDAIATGWLMGRQAKPLFGVAWQDWWTLPIEEVRSTFQIVLGEN